MNDGGKTNQHVQKRMIMHTFCYFLDDIEYTLRKVTMKLCPDIYISGHCDPKVAKCFKQHQNQGVPKK